VAYTEATWVTQVPDHCGGHLKGNPELAAPAEGSNQPVLEVYPVRQNFSGKCTVLQTGGNLNGIGVKNTVNSSAILMHQKKTDLWRECVLSFTRFSMCPSA
jgi:hypothetical protein